MNVFKLTLSFVFLLCFWINPVYAQDVSELKAMIQELRNEYESKIEMLENKINQLEAHQQQNVEKRVDAKVADLKESLKKEIKEKTIHAEYVGRDHERFGKGGMVAELPMGDSQVSVGGYMDHEFENFENTDSTFDQHRWIITIAAQLGERLRFMSEYEIEHGGPDQPGGKAKVEQAYVDYLIEDWVNLRAGAILAPFGRTNIYHDSDLRDLTSRPLVARDIIPTTWTEAGGGFFGDLYPTIGDYEDLEMSYEIYVVNGLDDGFTDTGMGGAKPSLQSDNNNNKAVIGRLAVSPLLGHEIGFSGYYGKYNDFGDSISGKGVDFLSKFGPLEFEGEYALFELTEPDFPVSGITDIADQYQGYYVQANYHFWPQFLDETFLGRSFDDPTFTLVARYGWAQIDDDSDSGTGDNEEERWTLGLNYRPVESWVLKLEYQWNETENEALERGDNNGFFGSFAMGF